MRRIIYIMVACILTVSCGEDNINKILDYAENIVVSRPDSALILLDSIKNPIKMPEQQARHILLTSYAKDLSGKDISTDTMIFYAKDYLETVNNPKYLALAEYCLGRIHQAQGKNDRALQLYLKAQTTAESSNDDDIKGLIRSYIGQQYYIQRKYSEAIDNFKSALEYFSKSKDNYKRAVSVLNKLGNAFLASKVRDSAMICYNKALQFAKIAQDSADIIHNRGVAYLTLNELYNAKQQLLQSLKLNSDSTLQSLIYLNLSRIYEKEEIIDSTVYFANLALLFTKENQYTLANIYNILSNVEKKRDNCKKVCEYYKQYTNCIIRTSNNIHKYNIQETEAKHKLNVFQNKYATYKLRSTILCIILITGFIVLCILIYKMKRKLTETKNILAKTQLKMKSLEESTAVTEKNFIKELSKNENSLTGALSKIKSLNEELSKTEDILKKTQFKLNEKENLADLYLSILKEIYNTINLLDIDPNRSSIEINSHFQLKVFNEYHKWSNIYNAEKNVFDKIKELYPQLNDTEYKIACLNYLGYSNLMIRMVIEKKEHTVVQTESKIRTKINIEQGGNIGIFIAEKMELDNELSEETQ